MAAKKMVIQLEKADDKASTKVMKLVAGISGVKSVAIDDKSRKLTIVCDHADPFCIMKMLRKPTPFELSWRQVKTCICPGKEWNKVEIISIEPVKDDKKKKEEEEKKKKLNEHINAIAWANYNYPYCLSAPYYYGK